MEIDENIYQNSDFIDKCFCADCAEIMVYLPPKIVDLVIADIPYNEGKAEWDKIDDYFGYVMPRLKLASEKMKDTAALYLFHMNFRVFSKLIDAVEEETDLIFRQFVTINKGIQSVAGRCSIDNLRSWPKASEYVAFFTFQDETGWSKIINNEGSFISLREYFKEEITKSGISRAELKRAIGGKADHCTRWDSSQWALPTKETYEQIRNYINKEGRCEYLLKEYNDTRVEFENERECLRGEYDRLHKEYAEMRYKFNLPVGVTDVWEVNFYEKGDKSAHPTKKPLKLIEQIIKAHTSEGDFVLDPFAGVFTTAIACKRLNRHYIVIEKNKSYYDEGTRAIKNVPTNLQTFKFAF